MRAFSPQDQWKKHKSEPILAMSEGLVEATADWPPEDCWGCWRCCWPLLLLPGCCWPLELVCWPTASSTASMTSGGNGGEQRRVVLHWLLHGGHQV